MDKLTWQNTEMPIGETICFSFGNDFEIGFADDLGCMNNCDGEYVCDTIDVNNWAKVA